MGRKQYKAETLPNPGELNEDAQFVLYRLATLRAESGRDTSFPEAEDRIEYPRKLIERSVQSLVEKNLVTIEKMVPSGYDFIKITRAGREMAKLWTDFFRRQLGPVRRSYLRRLSEVNRAKALILWIEIDDKRKAPWDPSVDLEKWVDDFLKDEASIATDDCESCDAASVCEAMRSRAGCPPKEKKMPTKPGIEDLTALAQAQTTELLRLKGELEKLAKAKDEERVQALREQAEAVYRKLENLRTDTLVPAGKTTDKAFVELCNGIGGLQNELEEAYPFKPKRPTTVEEWEARWEDLRVRFEADAEHYADEREDDVAGTYTDAIAMMDDLVPRKV